MQRYKENGVREERSGWRDLDLSQRHRLWGYNYPCVDVDFLAVEYHLGEPIALVEFKHCTVQKIDLSSPSFQAQRKMATRAGMPFLVAFYDSEFWEFMVYPVNLRAQEHFEEYEHLTEREFVSRLYEIRGIKGEWSVLSRLNTQKSGRIMRPTITPSAEDQRLGAAI